MLISFIGFDAPDKLDTRLAYREQHRARLKQLHEQDRIHSVGPMRDLDDAETIVGSIIIAEFDNIEQAKQWIAEDPYTINGLYQSMSMQIYHKLLP